MIYRLTLAAIAAIFFGIAAQSANAGLTGPERPMAQEMDHGVSQATTGNDYGTAMPPASEGTEPEAVESVPIPSEQGVSSSPGVAPATDPVTEPGSPEAAQQEEPEADATDGPTCEQLARQSELADAFAEVGLALGNALGPVLGSTLRKEGVLWVKESIRNDEEAEKKGCDAEQEAPA
jgi:hypothetical protein